MGAKALIWLGFSLAEGVGFEPTDRFLADHPISSRGRYNLFDTAADMFPRKQFLKKSKNSTQELMNFSRFEPSKTLVKSRVLSGPNGLTEIWFRVSPVMTTSIPLLKTKKEQLPSFFLSVVRRGIEPLFPPWEGGVLAAWPTDPVTQRLKV